MKSNQKFRLMGDDEAFTFIVPMTLAIIVGFSALVIGAYVIGVIGTELEESFPAAASRSVNQNRTISLIGNVTTGFGSVVDIEIVVIIITALSMAILAIMAIGSRRSFM